MTKYSLHVTRESMACVFMSHIVKVRDGLPADAKMVSWSYDPNDDTFWFVYESNVGPATPEMGKTIQLVPLLTFVE